MKSILELKYSKNINAEKEYLEMCRLAHEIFIKNQDGKKLLELLITNIIVNTPTANPGTDSSWAYFREGVNNCIRGLSAMSVEYLELIKQGTRNGK